MDVDLNEVNKRIADRSDCFYWQTDRKISAEEAAVIWKDRHSAISNDELLEKVNNELPEIKRILSCRKLGFIYSSRKWYSSIQDIWSS